MAKTIWDYLTDAGETMATLGTGAVAPFAGGAYGIYKGVTSPNYGTIQGGREADRAAIEMTNRLTYQPRGEATRGLLGAVGDAVGGAADFLKLPPVLPEAAILGALGLNNNAIMSQTQRGMQAAKPMVGNAMDGYMARTGLAPRMMPESPVMPTTPTAPVSPAGFYSAAEQAALNLPRNKGTGQALLNDLMKGADVKKDELQATGVLDAFANRPQATKQELVDYLQANRVEVGQTVKASQNPYPYKSAVEWQNAIFDAENNGNWGLADQISTAWEQYDGAVSSPKIPRYESYTMPGGENYREVLLTLPSNTKSMSYDDWVKSGREGEWSSSGTQSSLPDYQSTHWDEPNVMAHLRLNDRVDVDGKKMTLIEEVQSDWHQAGREFGYKTGNEKPSGDYQKEWNALTEERSKLLKEAANLPDSEMDRFVQMNEEIKRLGDEADRVDAEWVKSFENLDRVPEAAMKDTWYQTALRKAVKDAIDSGSDRVGIPTGGRQAERFGKGKRVVGMDIDAPEIDGTRGAQIRTDSGNYINIELDANGIITKGKSKLASEFVGKNLEEMIGKKAADEAMSVGNRAAGIKLDNVVVGGKGMKKYYDDIYPKYLDKFAKKYGSKVGDGSIDVSGNAEPIRYIDITPAMRKALGGKDKGVPLFQAAPLIPAGVAGSSGLLDQFGESEQ